MAEKLRRRSSGRPRASHGAAVGVGPRGRRWTGRTGRPGPAPAARARWGRRSTSSTAAAVSWVSIDCGGGRNSAPSTSTRPRTRSRPGPHLLDEKSTSSLTVLF